MREVGESQSSIDIVAPSALNHSISEADGVFSPNTPKRTGRSAGFSRRRRSSFLDTPSRSFCQSFCDHGSQVSSLSWQYALLLPCWLRPNSSPAVIIGTPPESSSVPSRLRMVTPRASSTAWSSVGPSTPWL